MDRAEPRVEIFSGPNCAYCEQAKALMERKGIPYEDYNIAEPAHMRELATRLPRARAVPQIFVNGEHIGNDQDLGILAGNGRLDAMLA